MNPRIRSHSKQTGTNSEEASRDMGVEVNSNWSNQTEKNTVS